jgi:hypothetical protein
MINFYSSIYLPRYLIVPFILSFATVQTSGEEPRRGKTPE